MTTHIEKLAKMPVAKLAEDHSELFASFTTRADLIYHLSRDLANRQEVMDRLKELKQWLDRESAIAQGLRRGFYDVACLEFHEVWKDFVRLCDVRLNGQSEAFDQSIMLVDLKWQADQDRILNKLCLKNLDRPCTIADLWLSENGVRELELLLELMLWTRDPAMIEAVTKFLSRCAQYLDDSKGDTVEGRLARLALTRAGPTKEEFEAECHAYLLSDPYNGALEEYVQLVCQLAPTRGMDTSPRYLAQCGINAARSTYIGGNWDRMATLKGIVAAELK